MTNQLTTDKALVGAAGVHHVAAQLSLRGLIALPTIRNTAGVDLVVTAKRSNWHANLQVKTSRSKVSFWPVGTNYKSWVADPNYYAFVRWRADIGTFEVFLEHSAKVAEALDQRLADEKARGLKDWAPCWFLKDNEERVRQQWLTFGRTEAR